MGLFLREEAFCAFLQQQYPAHEFTPGHAIISVNIVHMTPIMSCIYISDELVAAAKYQRQLEVFTDSLLFTKKQLSGIEFVRKGMGGQLLIRTKEKLPNDQPLVLTLNVSQLTGAKWHKENLKTLKQKYELSK